MKHLKTILAVAIVLIAMAMPSISAAQYTTKSVWTSLSIHVPT